MFLRRGQMDNLVDKVGGGSLEMGILSEAPLTAGLLTQRRQSLPRPRHGPQCAQSHL